MSNDYNSWQLVDLIKAKEEIEKAIEDKRKAEKQKMIEEMRERAEILGVSLDEIASSLQEKEQKKVVVVPKYRNPDDHKQVWAGRGRKPVWFVKCLENGMEEKDLLIEGQE